jgi:hypothetical protein
VQLTARIDISAERGRTLFTTVVVIIPNYSHALIDYSIGR